MKLTKLQPSTKVKGRWLAYLEDGTILRMGEGEVVSFALYSGMEMDDETLARLTAAGRVSGVKNRALTLITARPLSRRELIKKLVEKEAEPEDAEAAADWLEGLGYLSDANYARTVAEHYAAKGYGERKIRDELFRRGVPREHWGGAMEETEDPADGIDAFLRRKLKGETPDPKELKRASDALARRGYRWDDISAGLRRYGAEVEDGDAGG